jgi:hypothetical protein
VETGSSGVAAVSGVGEHDAAPAAGVLWVHVYTGPLGPIEVLSPAGQIAMLADQAEEAALVAEYGM